MEHFEGFGDAFGAPVETGEHVTQGGVECLYEAGF